MPDGGDAITIKIIDDIGVVPQAEWDACAAPAGAPLNPFVTHDFLHALERTDCTNAETGWLPQHLMIEDAGGPAEVGKRSPGPRLRARGAPFPAGAGSGLP